MFVSTVHLSHTAATAAVVLLLLLGVQQQSVSACDCSGPTDTITMDFIQETDAVGRFYVHSTVNSTAGGGDQEQLYYLATAHQWYKGDIGRGDMFIKTSASSATCGALVDVKVFSILFGQVSYEYVPGYAGKVPTLTISRCQPHKSVAAVSPAEWATLADYKNHVVCEATACDGLEQPTLDPLVCPRGTEYNQTAVCQGQVNGNCGWTVSATCAPLPYPDVCLESHCDGLDKPVLTCPTGTVMSSSNFVCDKQSNGSCGWKGSATCQTIVPVVPKGQVCALAACNPLSKPTLAPLTCPKGTEYKETAVCQGQDNGRCGWTVSATCVKVATTTGIVCVESDCANITKPTLPASFICPTGYKLTTTSTCVLQPTVGTCGWKVSGTCQKV